MNNFPDKDTIARLRAQYPPGTRVEFISMNDPYSKLEPGERGFVSEVDDIGTVHISWDSGSSLGAAYGADQIKAVSYITDTIREQIIALANIGKYNMLDCIAVQRLAFENDFYETVNLIEEDRALYIRFVLSGYRG
jgi:hypothetical protein